MGHEVPFPLEPPQYSLARAFNGSSGPKFSTTRFANDPDTVYIQATGVNPTPNFRTFFYIGPELRYPPRLHFANIPPDGKNSQVLTPYQVNFAYIYPAGGLNIPGIPTGAHNVIRIYTQNETLDVPIMDEKSSEKSLQSQSTTVARDDFYAWINAEPGPSKKELIVTGSIKVTGDGWSAGLSEASPQGINPDIKILDLTISRQPDQGGGAPHSEDVRYEETLDDQTYSHVTIRHNRGIFTIPVEVAF